MKNKILKLELKQLKSMINNDQIANMTFNCINNKEALSLLVNTPCEKPNDKSKKNQFPYLLFIQDIENNIYMFKESEYYTVRIFKPAGIACFLVSLFNSCDRIIEAKIKTGSKITSEIIYEIEKKALRHKKPSEKIKNRTENRTVVEGV